MPEGWIWPTWNGRPLQYLGGIDLKALARILSVKHRHGLPDAGRLELFADALGEGWGFDPSHAGSFAPFIIDVDVARKSVETPSDVRDEDGDVIDLELDPRTKALVPELVLPDCFDTGTRDLLDDRQFDRYWDIREELDKELFGGGPHHRVCGRPDVVQNPMELECQLASHGVYVGTPEGYESDEAWVLAPGAADWRLLAQIDTDEDLGLMWGDGGLIYWWIRLADAEAGRVDRCWGILQCS